MKVMPDMHLNEITDDNKALFLIGGTGWRSKSADALVPIVKRFLDQGKVVVQYVIPLVLWLQTDY